MSNNLRADLNAADPNRVSSLLRQIGFGDLLNLLIKAMTYTETGVTVTSNVATLANQPSTLWSVNATTATATGEKEVLTGPITGSQAVVPAAGQAVWDGGKKVLFATADVVTAAKFLYSTPADTTMGLLQRTLGSAVGT